MLMKKMLNSVAEDVREAAGKSGTDKRYLPQTKKYSK